MAVMGPTTVNHVEAFAGNLLRLARAQTGMSQRDLAKGSSIPQSVIAAIESGSRQPSWPLLCRILAGADLEPRVQLATYEDHDDVLDRRAAKYPDVQRAAEHARDYALAD
jgi:transcriptional regulator with XRE-family HTH domain